MGFRDASYHPKALPAAESAPLKAAPKRLVFDLPPEVELYEQDIRRFVDAMIYKLGKNAHKGRWQGYTAKTAMDGLHGEVLELREALDQGNTISIMLEAADVANFALICSSVIVENGK